jgi:hypothetical protein
MPKGRVHFVSASMVFILALLAFVGGCPGGSEKGDEAGIPIPAAEGEGGKVPGARGEMSLPAPGEAPPGVRAALAVRRCVERLTEARKEADIRAMEEIGRDLAGVGRAGVDEILRVLDGGGLNDFEKGLFLRVLATIGGEKAVGRLEKLAGGGAGRLREYAIRALEQSRDPKTPLILRRIVNDRAAGEHREMALHALVRRKDPGVARYLRVLVQDRAEDKEFRRSVLAVLVEWEGKACLGLLESLLKKGDPDMQREAVEGLGRIDDPAVIAILSRTCRAGGDPRLSKAILRVLGETRRIEAFPLLREALRGETDPGLRREAALALGRLPGEAPAGALREATRREKDDEVLAAVLEALGDVGGADDIPLLERFSKDPSRPAIRRSARAALEAIRRR